MSTQNLRLALALAVGFIPDVAAAQHDAHQMPGMQTPSAELSQCVAVQPAIQNIINAATLRAEAARLSNSPSELRAAIDHLEAALRDIRTQSAACETAAASADPHAGHAMPSPSAPSSPPTAQSPAAATDPHAGHAMPSAAPASKAPTAKPAPSTQSKPAASDPHAGHTMPSGASAPKSTAKPGPSTAKPAGSDPHAGHATSGAAPATKAAPASKTDASKSADPHAGHSAATSGDKQMDPVNGLMVDPATAPKTTYQGQTYYFSSEQSRKEFLENPAKFAKKPKG
jgi:YHS domain-containing protein